MEHSRVRGKILDGVQGMIKHEVIKDRRFLNDEQLIRSEQLAVLEEVFNANVRDPEIRELSCHFAPVFRKDHPWHLAVWGKTGTGKTLTMCYFLGVIAEMCQAKRIPFRMVHLDLATPRPCFRALNDLACLLNASKRYRKGISLEEISTVTSSWQVEQLTAGSLSLAISCSIRSFPRRSREASCSSRSTPWLGLRVSCPCDLRVMSLMEANPGNPATLATYRNDNTLGANRKITMVTMVTMLYTILVAN